MRTFLTPVDIANEIRMTRTLHDGAFLIVEGDTDARFYKRMVDSGKCRITIAYNRENAVQIVTILQGDNFAGFFAIVDADFDILEGTVFRSSNIFLTDTHDLETMMLKSPALEKLLLEMESDQSDYGRLLDHKGTIRKLNRKFSKEACGWRMSQLGFGIPSFMLPSGRGKRSIARSRLFRVCLELSNTESAHCLVECDREKGGSGDH